MSQERSQRCADLLHYSTRRRAHRHVMSTYQIQHQESRSCGRSRCRCRGSSEDGIGGSVQRRWYRRLSAAAAGWQSAAGQMCSASMASIMSVDAAPRGSQCISSIPQEHVRAPHLRGRSCRLPATGTRAHDHVLKPCLCSRCKFNSR